MQSFSKAKVVTRSGRTKYVFEPAFVFESDDPTNPLHGYLVNADSTTVVLSDGHKMLHVLRDSLVLS